jgi:hypothetical protein
MASPGKIRKQNTSMSGTRSPGLRIKLLRQARDSGREVTKVQWRHVWTEVWLVDQGATIATCGWNTSYYEFRNIPPACWYLETWGFLDSWIVLGLFLRHGAEVDFFSTRHLPQLTHQPLSHVSPSIAVPSTLFTCIGAACTTSSRFNPCPADPVPLYQ